MNTMNAVGRRMGLAAIRADGRATLGCADWQPTCTAVAGFGADIETLDTAASRTPAEVVDEIAIARGRPRTTRSASATADDVLAQTIVAAGDPKRLSACGSIECCSRPVSCLKRQRCSGTATSPPAPRRWRRRADVSQNRTLRRYALADFSAGARDLTRSGDADLSRFGHQSQSAPQRKLCSRNHGTVLPRRRQLHGKGCSQLARCFTGWEIKRRAFRFNRYQHDDGIKAILGKSGSFPGAEAVDGAEQPAAPQFIVGKLFNSLCGRAGTDRRADGTTGRELRGRIEYRPRGPTHSGSNLFFSPHAVGRKVRSPVDLWLACCGPGRHHQCFPTGRGAGGRWGRGCFIRRVSKAGTAVAPGSIPPRCWAAPT